MKNRYVIIKEYAKWTRPLDYIIIDCEDSDEDTTNKAIRLLKKKGIKNVARFLIIYFTGDLVYLNYAENGINRESKIYDYPSTSCLRVDELNIIHKEFKKWMKEGAK